MKKYYVPSMPSRAYLPQPTSGLMDHPRAQIQLNKINQVTLTKVNGDPLKTFTITLYRSHEIT